MKTKEEILKPKRMLGNIVNYDEAINAMDEYASQLQQEWIPVEVRLPEEGVPVLCSNANGEADHELLTIGIRFKDDNYFYLTEINEVSSEVTHWMAFPKQPQPYNPKQL